jgi:hypothetical protein
MPIKIDTDFTCLRVPARKVAHHRLVTQTASRCALGSCGCILTQLQYRAQRETRREHEPATSGEKLDASRANGGPGSAGVSDVPVRLQRQ